MRAVLNWAEENSNGRHLVVYVSARTDDLLRLIRLIGLPTFVMVAALEINARLRGVIEARGGACPRTGST